MMKNIFNTALAALMILISSILSAQSPPPPPPAKPNAGGIGALAAQPIDMYVVFLVIIALALIINYARKINFKKV